MTTTTKILIVGGVAVAAFLFLRKKAPSGTAFFSEFQVRDCQCFSVEFFNDGTGPRSTPTSQSNCADILPSLGCDGHEVPAFVPTGGKTSDGANLTAFDLFGPTADERFPGGNA